MAQQYYPEKGTVIFVYQITFHLPDGTVKKTRAAHGDNLLEIARSAGVDIDAPCSGNGVCGKCRIKLESGTLDTEKEKDGWRLACRSFVNGDVVIGVPDSATAFKAGIKVEDTAAETARIKNARQMLENAGFSFESRFSTIKLILDLPTLDDVRPDNERLCAAAAEKLGCETVKLSAQTLFKLPRLLRDKYFRVSCVVEKLDNTAYIHDIAGYDDPLCPLGVAIDIGTTGVSALMVDLSSGKVVAAANAGNGQIIYGADVINRIVESVKPGGAEKLRRAIVNDTINPMLAAMCEKIGAQPGAVCRVSVASNTTMNHLLLGLFADPIRMEPYIPAFFEADALRASDLGFNINSAAPVLIAPNVGSYVGGDITAGVLTSGLWNDSGFSLFVDLGTNGELVFGNQDLMMCCACSAGPAFEGGSISCGMRATAGAVEACKIDENLQPELTVNGGGKPAGVCGSGLIDMVSELFRHGAINAKGRFIKDGDRIKRDEFGQGRYVFAFDAQTGRELSLNEVDIDNFIRAKGAIYSAIMTMLAALDFDQSMIERVYIAGGIGSGINMANAVFCGMLPNIPIEKYHYLGNTSLSGAYAMLVSAQAEEKMYELGRGMTYMELSTVPGYMNEFIAACFLPHTDASLFAPLE